MKFRRILFIVTSAALLSAGFALSQEVNDGVIPMPQDEVVQEVNDEVIPMPQDAVVVPQAEIDIPAWNQIRQFISPSGQS